MYSAFNQNDDGFKGSAAREAAESLKLLAVSVRGVVATTDDDEARQSLLDSTQRALDEALRLLTEAAQGGGKSPQVPGLDSERMIDFICSPALTFYFYFLFCFIFFFKTLQSMLSRLGACAKNVSQALNMVFDCLPSQREIERAIARVDKQFTDALATPGDSSGASFAASQVSENKNNEE